MAIIMKNTLFAFCLALLLGWAQETNQTQANCNNPLYSAEDWDSSLGTRPAYLSTPQEVSSDDLKFCSKVLRDSTLSCCDANTVAQIEAIFKEQKGKNENKTDEFGGRIRDTFNDFDPDNQKDYGDEYDEDGYYVGKNETRRLQDGQKEDGQKENGQKEDGQKENGKGKRSPEELDDKDGKGLPKGDEYKDREEDLEKEDEELKEQGRGRPEDRGRRRKRGGFDKMGDERKAKVKEEARAMNDKMKDHAKKGAKCIKGLMKHMTGMLCMGCDPNWENYVSEDSNGEISVKLNQNSCDKLSEDCTEYMKSQDELPSEIKKSKDAIEAEIKNEATENSEVTEDDFMPEDLEGLVDTESTKKVCENDEDCKKYICEELPKGEGGLGPKPDDVADPNDVEESRRLSSSVTYTYTEDGGFDSYESIDEASLDTTVEVDGETGDEDSASLIILSSIYAFLV